MAYQITNLCIGCGVCTRVCPVAAIAGKPKQRHRIAPAICIACGACGRVCPHGSITDPHGKVCERIRIRSHWPRPVFDPARCMACTICIEACPTGCLDLNKDRGNRETLRRPYLRSRRDCIACSFCEQSCPVDAISMTDNDV